MSGTLTKENNESTVIDWTMKEILREQTDWHLDGAIYEPGTLAYFRRVCETEEEARAKRKEWRRRYCRAKMRERRMQDEV